MEGRRRRRRWRRLGGRRRRRLRRRRLRRPNGGRATERRRRSRRRPPSLAAALRWGVWRGAALAFDACRSASKPVAVGGDRRRHLGGAGALRRTGPGAGPATATGAWPRRCVETSETWTWIGCCWSAGSGWTVTWWVWQRRQWRRRWRPLPGPEPVVDRRLKPLRSAAPGRHSHSLWNLANQRRWRQPLQCRTRRSRISTLLTQLSWRNTPLQESGR